MAAAQNPASKMLASDSPWPVSALVELIAGLSRWFVPKTVFNARSSVVSQMGV